jgi:hypothetical protein
MKFECLPAVNEIIHTVHDQAVSDNAQLAIGIAFGKVMALITTTEATMFAEAKATPCPESCSKKTIGKKIDWSLSHFNLQQRTQTVGQKVVPIQTMECDIAFTGVLKVTCEKVDA